MKLTLIVACLAGLALAAQLDPTGTQSVTTVKAKHGQTLADFVNLGSFYQQHDVDPGLPAEGDYMDRVVFTRDGAKAIVSNRMTDNVTVFDWATMAAETTVDVGSYPAGMAVSDSLLVIARPFADSVTIVRLSDWAIVARLGSGTQPWVVRVSPDQTRAYVGCDIETGLGLPRWEGIFAAYGITCHRLLSEVLFDDPEVEELMSSPDPVGFLVPIDPEQTYYPKIASRITASGSMASDPLHQMTPALPAGLSSIVMPYLNEGELE